MPALRRLRTQVSNNPKLFYPHTGSSGPFNKRSFVAESGKARFPLPQTLFKTKVVVEGF
jgi:hypothetical protein